MNNKKSRIIVLSLFLAILIALGTFIILNNMSNNENRHIAGDNTFSEDQINNDKDNESQVNNDNENKKNGKFYYIEEFVSESLNEGGTYDSVFTINDEIAIYNEGYLQNVKTKENIIKLPDDIGSYFAINEEGFYNVKYDKDTKKIIFSSFDLEGNKKESMELKDFKGLVFDDSYIILNDMEVTKNYIYLLVRGNRYDNLHIYTKSGELKNSYENVRNFDVDGAENVCISAHVIVNKNKDEKPYIFYMVNSETGEEIFKNTFYNLDKICFSKDEKFIYGFERNEDKINIYSAVNGNLIKSVLEFGIDSTYLLEDYSVNDMLVGKDDEIIWWMGTKLEDDQDLSEYRNFYYLYTKQEGERPKRQVTLNINEPYRSEYIEEAIKIYELKNQNEHIEYNYAYNTIEEYNNNYEEYSAKLALDIIQGNVGDIVRMTSLVMGDGGIDYQNLFRTDVFMDLTDLINEDKNYKYLNKDVLNAIKINDAIRGLPITFTFNLWELNEDFEKQLGLDLDFNNMSWSDILNLVKVIEEKFPDKHLFTSFAEGEAWEQFGFGNDLLTANMPNLINLETKEIDLNQQWFKDLLIKFKECSKSKNFILKAQFDRVDMLKGSLLAPRSSSGGYYNDLVGYYSEYNKLNKSRLVPAFTGEKNNNRVGYTKMMYSINNRSERKENAWKFLSFLLEEDKVQYAASREKAELISEKGFDYMLAKSISKISVYDSKTNSKVDPYKTYREKYNKAIKEFSHKIDYLYDMGNIKNDLIEAIKLYMKDELTLDEALKKAEDKILIRLNE